MIRQLPPYQGSHWLTTVVVAGILSTCLAWFLDAIVATQELVERTQVDLAARGMRTGLQLAVGEAMMRGRAQDVAQWHGENPVRWLDPMPAGYRGECSATESERMPAGAWCFERETRQLVYAPKHDRHLRLAGDGDAKGGLRLRWWVAVERDPLGYPSASVKVVTAYSWQID